MGNFPNYFYFLLDGFSEDQQIRLKDLQLSASSQESRDQ